MSQQQDCSIPVKILISQPKSRCLVHNKIIKKNPTAVYIFDPVVYKMTFGPASFLYSSSPCFTIQIWLPLQPKAVLQTTSSNWPNFPLHLLPNLKTYLRQRPSAGCVCQPVVPQVLYVRTISLFVMATTTGLLLACCPPPPPFNGLNGFVH